MLETGSKLTIAVDLDGVLCLPTDYQNFDKAEPIEENIEAVRKLKKEGHTIVIYTARASWDLKVTKEWLKRHNVPYDHLVMGKFLADYYIDDRCTTFEKLLKRHLPEQNKTCKNCTYFSSDYRNRTVVYICSHPSFEIGSEPTLDENLEVPDWCPLRCLDNGGEGFEKYFEDIIEYPPKELLVDSILPPSVLLCHVSTSFLDGFINYVKLIRVWLLRSYTHPAGPTRSYQLSVKNESLVTNKELSMLLQDSASLLSKDNVWSNYLFLDFESFLNAWFLNKQEVVSLSSLYDNLLILAKSKSFYWFFWYSTEVSDCCAGRFRIKDPEDLVVNRFDSYVKEKQNYYNTAYGSHVSPVLISVDKLKGWLKW